MRTLASSIAILTTLAAIASGCGDDTFDLERACEDPVAAGLEHCLVHDGGWNFYCAESMVYVEDLTEHWYCFENDDTEPVCVVGGPGNESLVAACGGPCATDEIIWVETVEEFDNFDLSRVCTD